MLEKIRTTIIKYLTINNLISFFIGSLIFFITSIIVTLSGFGKLSTLLITNGFVLLLVAFEEVYRNFNSLKNSKDKFNFIYHLLPSLLFTLLIFLLNYG